MLALQVLFFFYRVPGNTHPQRDASQAEIFFIKWVCEMLYTPGVSSCTRVFWEICPWIQSLIKPSIPPGSPGCWTTSHQRPLKILWTYAPWNTSLPKTEFEYSKCFPLNMCCFIRLYLYTKHLERMQCKLYYLVDQQFSSSPNEEAMEDFII